MRGIARKGGLRVIKITIPGRPVPYVRMTRNGKFVKKNAQRYLTYKNTIGYIAKSQIKAPSDKIIHINVLVYLNGKTTPMGKDGDADNYLKAACDGLNKIAYIDDRQVWEAHVKKVPCDKKNERMEIMISEVGGVDYGQVLEKSRRVP